MLLWPEGVAPAAAAPIQLRVLRFELGNRGDLSVALEVRRTIEMTNAAPHRRRARPSSEPSFLRDHGLSLVLVGLFAVTLAGQALTGWIEHNVTERDHLRPGVSFAGYLGTGHFWEATGENWESGFLQMAAFVLLTTFLYQKGSAESKRPGVVEEVDLDPRRYRTEPDVPGPVRRGGWQLRLYEHSLGLTFVALFLVSVGIHAIGGLHEYNSEQTEHGHPAVTLGTYLWSARFWFESFQNWQSEFLSLAAMVIATIFLRQRGSPESKPVHAPHGDTGKA
jgi:hypothetical protein